MTPRAKDYLRHSATPRGQFVVKAHHITLTLNHQLEGCDTRIFDDSTPVSGFVELDHSGDDVEKLEVQESLSIWDSYKPEEARVQFKFNLPRPENARLPPTYQAHVGAGDAQEVNGFRVAVEYTITIRSHERHTGPVHSVPGHLGDLLDHTYPPRSRYHHSLQVEIPHPHIFSLRHAVAVVLRIQGSELTFAKIQASPHRLTIIALETQMTDPEAIGRVELQRVTASRTGESLVFAGDIPVDEHVTTGTFSTERLSDHDFLVIEIVPPRHEREALLKDSRISIPTNFTAD
ncbi:hypothetical protein AURDEDRAFT_118806 [Auricularia subglabra TFB-10046 SS5]|nr:hypothetical protein AURDEDRAFT_118806 [Auricularia subglabra TFB-10046 SS5]